MNTEQARAVVKETFPQAFDKVRFHQFARELLNGFDETKTAPMAVPDNYAPHVRSCSRLGTYKSPDGELADVLIVNTTEPWKLERTRTALRDFVAHKLKRGDNYKEAGLVAFVAPDAHSWRFSFVHMEYESKRDAKTGKIAIEKRLTPARRFSYIVGENESCHTAQSRFLDLLQNTENKPTLAQIEKAFSVEAVTKEFFEQYKALFLDLKEELDALAKKDKTIGAEFAAKNVSTADFAKKLMGQIVFLYFLQKKGWLGVSKGGDWGDSPHNFFRQLFDGKFGGYKNFFNDILEPLFYDTLATDRGHDAWCKIFNCRIPFLNGGLFEPIRDYDWQKTDIIIPNALFSNTKTTKAGDTGTGILDVFDRYNFTVNEAEPLEKEVAIDPEMLGKVFENLLEVKERKSKGSFYTPREIVHYMCQDSLINYLDTAINTAEESVAPDKPKQIKLFDKPEQGQNILKTTVWREIVPRGDIELWIGNSDRFASFAAAIASGTKGEHYPKPPKPIIDHARLIDEKLATITVCDPAIGSGAFPVDMMQEIVRARSALTPCFNDFHERTPYFFKRHAIQYCLYGVDIDPGAVEIAKLRLWLSLVVDEDDIKQIKPLPNLDYKIVVGNSLLGVKKRVWDTERRKRLQELIPRHVNATERKQKEQFKHEIDDIIHELTNGKETFDFEIYFWGIFHTKGGFDVVIANPPYVRQESIKELKPALKAAGYECFTGTADLLVYFYERGVKLLRGGGTIALITSNKFYRASYGEKLRGFLTRELTLHRLIYFGDAPVFEAIAYASILAGVRTAPADDASVFAYTWEKEMAFDRIAQIVPQRGQQIRQSELKPDGWRLESPAVLRLLEKLRCAGKPLGEYVNGRFYRGILTGLNEAFVVDRATSDRLICEHKSSADILKPFLRGRDVKRWRTAFAEQYLIKIESSENKDHPWSGKSEAEKIFNKTYPAIYEHFQSLRDIKLAEPDVRGCRNMLEKVQRRDDQGKYFWELRSCIYWQEFEQTKLVVPAISDTVNVSLDSQGYFSNNKTSIFVCDNAVFVSGVVNWRLALWFAHQVFATKQGGFLDFEPRYSSQWPIPAVPPEQQKSVERLVERILSAKQRDAGADVSALEREIDELVYALYGLTPEEIKLVEGTAK